MYNKATIESITLARSKKHWDYLILALKGNCVNTAFTFHIDNHSSINNIAFGVTAN